MGLSEASQVVANPFVILTLIVAPAILTNASALMIMSTSNRFARAVDRGRDLSRQIVDAQRSDDSRTLERLNGELLLTEKRTVLLLNSMRSFYFSLGGFAFATVISLIGAGLVTMHLPLLDRALAIIAVTTVFLAVGGLGIGSILLFYETRIAVAILQDRIKRLNENYTSEL
jgi:hypothetical protein